MDDPLLGLAMWETETEASRLKRHSSTCSKNSKNSANPVEQNPPSIDPSPPPPPLPSLENTREETREKDTNMSSHNSSECFPCLSALDQDLEQKLQLTKHKEKGTDPKGDEHTDSTNETQGREVTRFSSQSPEPLLENFWLLRLFESNLFSMHIALQYLFREKDINVQKYLGRKLKVREVE